MKKKFLSLSHSRALSLFLILFIQLIALNTHAQSGIINTIFTGTYYGFNFNNTWVTTDANCNVYFSQPGSHYIKKIDASTGAISTITGQGVSYPGDDGDGGPATAAKIDIPDGLCFDNNGNLYFVDGDYGVVRKINSSGIITTFAGNAVIPPGHVEGFSATAVGLYNPEGIAYDPTGNIVITEVGSVVSVNIATNIITTIAGNSPIGSLIATEGYSGDGGPATDAEMRYIDAVACDNVGNVYICDENNQVVRKIDHSTHIISLFAGTPGTYGYSGDGGPATAATFGHIPPSGPDMGLATDASGNVYISDNINSVIRKVNTSGIISTIAGTGAASFYGDGGPATAADLFAPTGIATNSSGNLFVCDDIQALTSSIPTHIREICLVGTPSVTVTAPSTSCSGSNPTFTATLVNGCGVIYNWYKSVDGGATFSLASSCEGCNTFTDASASNGEKIYCDVIISSYTDICNSGTYTSNTITLAVTNLQVADVNINTLCIPGTPGADASSPVYTTAITGGTTPYSYTWAAETGNDATLNTASVASPTVTAVSSSPYTGRFLLTVTDASGCTATRDVFTQFNSNLSYDLASRDSHFDMYDEPNSQQSYNAPQSSDLWDSPDIVNRLHADGIFIQEPTVYTLGHDNYLYVKIRNVGCMNYSGASVPGYDVPNLNVYWTVGGMGGTENWCDPAVSTTPTGICLFANAWTDALRDGVSGLVPQGLQILTSEAISSAIDAGNSAIYPYISWTPPNPQVYEGAPVMLHQCFLSRIVDYHNTSADPVYGMTTMEHRGDPAPNVINNNNLAIKNSSVIELSSYPLFSPTGHGIYTSSFATGLYSIQFANNHTLIPNSGTSILNHFAYFKVYLGALFDKWQRAGAYGTYTTINTAEKSVTFDGSTMVQLDSIGIDSGSQYLINIVGFMNDGIDGRHMPEETINFRELSDASEGAVMGNYSFLVKYSDRPSPKGVLAVTEISQGPDIERPGCEYAEMIVANCGDDASSYVDVSGWIIDDNAGNFDTVGCAADGTTQGHYRLSPDNKIWKNALVGSRIVVYNADVNCYDLPTTFTIDTPNAIYWVPIPRDQPCGDIHSAVIERYSGAENGSKDSYCSDTGKTVYTATFGWEQTIALDRHQDAIQVRCPGCTKEHPEAPAFYQGIGYAPDTTFCFVSIPNGTNSLGGPVKYNPFPNQKYEFIGRTANDFRNPQRWLASDADASGSVPATLGYVDSALYANVFTHQMGLPCCGDGKDDKRTTSGNTNTTPPPGMTMLNTSQAIRVYPVPASMMLYFEFPAGNVTIKLMDMTGRVMDEQKVQNTGKASFNIRNYPAAMYMYQVITNGSTKSGKFIVE